MDLGILCGLGSSDHRIVDRIKKRVKPGMSNTPFGIDRVMTPRNDATVSHAGMAPGNQRFCIPVLCLPTVCTLFSLDDTIKNHDLKLKRFN
jgi:hypothetical protein